MLYNEQGKPINGLALLHEKITSTCKHVFFWYNFVSTCLFFPSLFCSFSELRSCTKELRSWKLVFLEIRKSEINISDIFLPSIGSSKGQNNSLVTKTTDRHKTKYLANVTNSALFTLKELKRENLFPKLLLFRVSKYFLDLWRHHHQNNDRCP